MNSSAWLSNLTAWWLQTGIVTAMAAMLLRTMPVGSPRATLSYLQALQSLCLVLPALEPWRVASAASPAATSAVSTLRISALSAVPISFPSVMLVLLSAGIAVRLIWLTVGYWRLRRYRQGASLVDAEAAGWREKLGVKAEMWVSSEISTPVTFGFWRPTVLLPACWPDLDPASRTAIAYHELLHVRRNDWVFHLGEEILRALVWFHPAVWWLTAEIRLAREQVVDRRVIEFTGGRKSYAEVLLAFAGIDSAVTAPAFTRKRHLARRIQLVLEEVTMSKSRLLVSFASITLCVLIAGAVAVWSFPLESVESNLITSGGPAAGIAGGVVGGVPGGVQGGVIGGVVGGVPGAGRVAAEPQSPRIYKIGGDVSAPQVLYKVDPEYTKEARDAKIEGVVVVQTEIHPDGRAHNTTVIQSLDPGLDRNATEAISKWKFEPGKKGGKAVAVTATIEVNYRLN